MFVITAHPKFFEMVDIMDVLYSPNSYHIPASYLESLPEDRVPVFLSTKNRITYHVGYVRPEKVCPDLGLVQVYQGFNNPELYYGYDEVYPNGHRFVRYDEDIPDVENNNMNVGDVGDVDEDEHTDVDDVHDVDEVGSNGTIPLTDDE